MTEPPTLAVCFAIGALGGFALGVAYLVGYGAGKRVGWESCMKAAHEVAMQTIKEAMNRG